MKNPVLAKLGFRPGSRMLGQRLLLGLVSGVLLLGVGTLGAAEPANGAAQPSYSDQWGPAVGSRLPLLAAADQTGTQRTLADLVGRNGLLLVLVRSADW